MKLVSTDDAAAAFSDDSSEIEDARTPAGMSPKFMFSLKEGSTAHSSKE